MESINDRNKEVGRVNSNFFLFLLHIVAIASGYIFFLLPIIKSTTILPGRDNAGYHLANYLYFSNSLLFGFGFPLWHPSHGGIPIGVTSIQMFPFAPHRIIGYLLYLFLPFDPVTMYKINLMSGMLVIIIGWWLFLFRITKSRLSSTFGCLMVIWGGTGITVFHQEQIISTMTWIPWVLLTLIEIQKEHKFIFILAILLGFSMTAHYPQIYLILYSFIFLALILSGKAKQIYSKLKFKIKLSLPLAIILFILAASPALYINKTKSDFSSPLRNSERMEVTSLADYIAVNRLQVSSAHFKYLVNYIAPKVNVELGDQCLFFVTIIGIGFTILGLGFKFKPALPLVIVTFFCAWAVLGINGYLPQILYLMHFPFTGYFRQWYHFAPILNLGLSALGALGFSVFLTFLSKKVSVFGRKILNNLLIGVLLLSVFTCMFYESKWYLDQYVARYLIHVPRQTMQRFSKDEFFDCLKSNLFFKARIESAVASYKEFFRLFLICPEVIYRPPFSTNIIYDDVNIRPRLKNDILKDFYYSGLSDYAVILDTPSSKINDLKMSLPKIFFLEENANIYNPDKQNLKRNVFFSMEDFIITPKGVSLEGNVQTKSLIVFPFAYKLGFIAYLNHQKVETYSVYYGGMTGIIVPGGKFNLNLIMPISVYHFTVFIQALLLFFVLIFTLTARRRVCTD